MVEVVPFFIKLRGIRYANLTSDAIQLANLADMIPLDLSEPLGSIFQPCEVRLLHVLSDGLVRLTGRLQGHLLSCLLEFELAPLQVRVDCVAEDCNLRVQLFVLSVIELRLKPVSLGSVKLAQLLIYLQQHVLDLLCSVNPNGWKC